MVIYKEMLFGHSKFEVRVRDRKIHIIDEKMSSESFILTRRQFIDEYSCMFEPEVLEMLLQEVDIYL